MVFVVDAAGRIKNINRAAESVFPGNASDLLGSLITQWVEQPLYWFRKLKNQLDQRGFISFDNIPLRVKPGVQLPVSINATTFTDVHGKQLILFIATDISYRVRTENLIIRAIIDTQEKERQRLAQDFHDSLTQQLSAIKFSISAVLESIGDKKQKKILQASNAGLAEVIRDIRNICFNLMPKTLEEFGLVKAVKEFYNHSLLNKNMHLIIEENRPLPELGAELNIDLYRITQEFISNAVNHGHASRVLIGFNYLDQELRIVLKDNGVGFDPQIKTDGMGLQNVQSRLKSHHASLKIITAPYRGVRFEISVPLNKQL